MIQWRYLPNHRAQVVHPMPGKPWEVTADPTPVFEDKKAWRDWCADARTSHCFYTPVEAANAQVRVSGDNPAFRLHGFVADFDAKTGPQEVKARIENLLPEELRPIALSQTYSGHARAVWEFESPVWVDAQDLAELFIKRVVVDLKLQKLAPGYDPQSEDLSQFWELGTGWIRLDAKPIPTARLIDWQSRAILKLRRARTEVEIPLEEARAGVEKRYPGRLGAVNFSLGSRIPLFWIDDGNPDLSAVVAEWGVHSFSTRSDKGSSTWADLLGSEFVDSYRATRYQDAIDKMWWDGTAYWEFNGSGTWNPNSESNTVLSLKVRGYSSKMGAKQTCSETDKILYLLQHSKRVDCALPLTFTRQEVFEWHGERFLNVGNKAPMAPAQYPDNGAFPWVWSFFENFLEQHSTDVQHPCTYLLAELQRAYRAVIEGKPRSGRALIFCGPAGRGKSFFATNILRHIFGSGTDAGAYLMSGGQKFNRYCGESYVWFVDDNISASSLVEHTRFTEAVKKHVATPEVQYHPKWKDVRAVPWYGRIIVTCNDDPDSIGAIPSLDRTTLDKLSLFKVSKWQANFLPNDEMNALLLRELPFFLRWLLDTFDASGVMDQTPGAHNRYGVLPYWHKELVELSQESSPELRLVEVLDMWWQFIGGGDPAHGAVETDAEGRRLWVGTSTQLLAILNGMPDLQGILRQENPRNFGRFMTKLSKSRGWEKLIGTRSTRTKSAVWVIELPEKVKRTLEV